MRFRATALFVSLLAFGCAAQPPDVDRPTPAPSIVTVGVAPESTKVTMLSRADSLRYAAMAARIAPCEYAWSTASIRGTRYIGCNGNGMLIALGPTRRSHAKVEMGGINSIVSIGTHDIGVSGSCCEPIRSMAVILDERTLRPILHRPLIDSTVLGVVGDRIYIDDWCCNGRGDVYAPATIYSISLADGEESPHTDLKPDPQFHPADQQPLGQGGDNYLIGTSFYVVVGPVTYRYDVRDLQRAPTRLATS